MTKGNKGDKNSKKNKSDNKSSSIISSPTNTIDYETGKELPKFDKVTIVKNLNELRNVSNKLQESKMEKADNKKGPATTALSTSRRQEMLDNKREK
ncbi:MAG: hypothetical protein J0H68_08460 [Sphingobacteriia bacterium]|nr:hypothetical protein [Sphingobacteriia bacterium]